MSDKSVPYTRFFENDKDDAVPSSSSYEEIYTPGAAAAVLTGQAAQRAIPMRMQDQDDDHPYKSVSDENAGHIRGLIDDYKKIHGGQELTGNAVEIATKLSSLFRQKLTEKVFKEIEEAVGKYYIPYRDRNRLQSQASTTAVLAGQAAAAVATPAVGAVMEERRSLMKSLSPSFPEVNAFIDAVLNNLPEVQAAAQRVGGRAVNALPAVVTALQAVEQAPYQAIVPKVVLKYLSDCPEMLSPFEKKGNGFDSWQLDKKLMLQVNPKYRDWKRARDHQNLPLYIYEREPTTSPAMMTKLIGRNNLARKLMVNLALNKHHKRHPNYISMTPMSMTQKQRQMADLIQRRVDATKGREARLPRITMNELHAYAFGTVFDPNAFHQPNPDRMPPKFPTEVQPLPPFTEASCLTTKKQLQQQRDELIKLLEQKKAMLFNLQRIHYASNDETYKDKGRSEDNWFQENCGEFGVRPRDWCDHFERAEQKSREAITTLKEQLPELRERIDQLTATINKPSCTMLGGSKTKSKYTKSKKTKRRNRKYSKRN